MNRQTGSVAFTSLRTLRLGIGLSLSADCGAQEGPCLTNRKTSGAEACAVLRARKDLLDAGGS